MLPMVGASVPRPSDWAREQCVYFAAMLRTTIGVLSDSDALAPSFDPEETHAEFACWISGTLGNRATRLSRDHEDWARATDHAESPKRSNPRRRTVRKGVPICQRKPIRDPSRQDPASNKHSRPNGETSRAVLPEPVSCNGGEENQLCSHPHTLSGLNQSPCSDR